MPQVFISYSRKDIAFIEQLADDLKIARLDAWYDLSGLEGGVRWSKEIEKAIKASQFVIVVLSPDSVASTWVEEEILYAKRLGRKIIPILYRPCDIPFGLHTLNFIDVQNSNYRQNYKEILRALDIERSEREIAEKTIREKAEAILKARQDAEEHARIEKEEKERKATILAAEEKAKRDAVEKTKRERVEQRTAQITALKEKFSKSLISLKSTFTKTIPFLRFVSFAGIAITLIWVGSWGLPQLTSLIPTPKASLTSTLRPSDTFTFTVSPQMPTKTLTPKPTATKTQTPTPLPTEITDNKSVPMVLVPASEFTMGADFYENTKPEHQVYLDEYYMDIYEVTNGRYHECVIAGVCNTPGNSGSYTRGWFYYWETEYKNYPVIYVDWLQANLYCEWRGGRLPTEAEWEKSARGEGNGPYPWGEGINSDLANFGNYPGDTTEVGSYLDGKSIYGIYDMAGNVWEWVSTLYKNYPYTANDGREEVNDPGKRVIRGGAWDNRDIYLRVFNRQDAVPSGRNFNLGFRCAKDAP